MTTENRANTRQDLRDQGWRETTDESWEYGRTLLYEDAAGWHLHHPQWSADFSDDTPSGVIALTCAFVMIREDKERMRRQQQNAPVSEMADSCECPLCRNENTPYTP